MSKVPGSTKACKKCGKVYLATREYFGSLSNGSLRGTCRACVNSRSRSWSMNNQDSVRQRSVDRRARVGGWLPTNELRQKLFTEQLGLCALCGELMENFLEGEVDHLTPAVKGGSNHISNLALAHVSCNREKANKTLGEHIAWRSLVGLPASTYSSEKLRKAILKGIQVTGHIDKVRARKRKNESSVKVTGALGMETDLKLKNEGVDSRNGSAEKSEQIDAKSRDTTYRYVGTISPDCIGKISVHSHDENRKRDRPKKPVEAKSPDTTYRFGKEDLSDSILRVDPRVGGNE
jgi:5-methylcytosine-specific restriction endonuclease McrA